MMGCEGYQTTFKIKMISNFDQSNNQKICIFNDKFELHVCLAIREGCVLNQLQTANTKTGFLGPS